MTARCAIHTTTTNRLYERNKEEWHSENNNLHLVCFLLSSEAIAAGIINSSDKGRMASLYGIPERPTPKHYRSYFSSFQDQLEALKDSTTVYVGNLDFSTTEDRIQDLFSRCGVVQRVVMGLNRFDLTQCGFCFVM